MRVTKAFIIFIALSAIALISGCTGKGDLTFKKLPSTAEYDISGQIVLPEIIETDLKTSLRHALMSISDFTTFNVSSGNLSVSADASGNFSIKNIPFSDSIVLKAKSNKIELLKRVYPNELDFTDLSQTKIDIDSTAKALIWQFAKDSNKELTLADISAREYAPYVASVSYAIKLALQMPDSSVTNSILEVPAVATPAKSAAAIISSREYILRDSNSVFRNILLRKDLDLLKVYISPSFSNDWDSTSNWNDIISYFTTIFAEKKVLDVEWNVQDIELTPENTARVRTEAKLFLKDILSDQNIETQKFTFDAIWRKEGSFWKIMKNLPYRLDHPSQVGADTRWGELAEIHTKLKAAIAVEDTNTLESYISDNFRNDFDVTSNKNDLIKTAQARFNAMDVKISTYAINKITFTGTDSAEVDCTGQVKVINLIPGLDIDSGSIHSIIEWRRENGVWKIFRNLPYRFTHPKN